MTTSSRHKYELCRFHNHKTNISLYEKSQYALLDRNHASILLRKQTLVKLKVQQLTYFIN
uniref:Protein SCO1 homolog 1 n=1 Tax=Rhizophora mucronata TaxID=61149 RepID=A0A2P2J8Z3_RHIMU